MVIRSIHNNRIVPNMTVFELPIAQALSRTKSDDDLDLLITVEGWLLRAVRGPDVSAALARMAECGWVELGEGIADSMLTDRGREVVDALFEGCMRMLDRGTGLMSAALLGAVLRSYELGAGND